MTTFAVSYDKSGYVNDTESLRRNIIEYQELLAGCGLVKLDIAGSIDPATVNYPASGNTAAGFEVWRFNDTLQAVAPIFLKFEYGRGSNGGAFAIWLTVGHRVNDAGGITGELSGRFTLFNYADSQVLNGAGYSCHTEGFAGVLRRPGVVNSAYGSTGAWAVCRSCDANGYPTSDGIYVIGYGSTRPAAQSARISPAPGIVSGISNAVFEMPLGVSSSIGGDVPFYPVWMPLPQLVPVFGIAAYPTGMVTTVDFVDIAIVGSRVRRYIVGPCFFTGSTGNTNGAFAMLWE